MCTVQLYVYSCTYMYAYVVLVKWPACIAVGGGRSRNRVSEQRNRSIYQSRYLWYLRYLLEVRARTELIPLKGTWYQAAVW